MDERELAYAAGLFDGEGTVQIFACGRRGTGHYRLRVSVSSTDFELAAFFQDRWPGHVAVMREADERRRQQLRWDVNGPRAAAFLRDVLPYMRKERGIEKARLGIEFQEQKDGRHVGKHPEREAYMARQRDYHVRMLALTGRRALAI